MTIMLFSYSAMEERQDYRTWVFRAGRTTPRFAATGGGLLHFDFLLDSAIGSRPPSPERPERPTLARPSSLVVPTMTAISPRVSGKPLLRRDRVNT